MVSLQNEMKMKNEIKNIKIWLRYTIKKETNE